MSKNTNIADLINYISVDGSGNVVLTTGGQVATQSYVTTAVSNLVNAAPSTLDTLNELAAALGNDANFATTVTNSIATKQTQLNGTGFVKVSGTTVSYDNSTYLTTSSASSSYVTLATLQTISGLKTFDATISANYGIALLNGAIPALTSIYYAALSGNSTGISITYRTGGGTNYTNNLNFPDLNNSYLFPSASGTLALTSDLGAYLPLTGGTLTGALSGTSATFSGDLTIAKGSPLTIYNRTATNEFSGLQFKTSGTNNFGLGLAWNGASTDFEIYNYSTSSTALKLNYSNNAATFSSKISVRGGTDQGGYYMDYQSDAASRSFRVSSENLVFGDFVIQRSTTRTGTTYENLLYFDASRAATFSSSVGVGGSPSGTYGTLSVFGGISTKDDNNGKLEIGRYSSGASNSYIKLGANSNSLRITNNNDTADIFTITNSGNVGIGTISPNAVATGARVLQVDGSAYGFILASSGSVIGQFAGNSGGIVTFGARSNHDVTFTTNDVERMRLTAIGPGTIGCLLVNKTTASTSYPIQTQSANGAYMASANGPGDANFYSTSPTIGYHIYGDQGGAAKFNVTGAGKGYFAAGVQFGNGSGTLNYYEEGDWTPQLVAGGTPFQMGGINAGKYIRIGNQVTVTGHLQWSGGSASGMVAINGLPFTSSGVRTAGSIGAVGSGISFNSGYGQWILVNDPSTSFIYIIQQESDGSGYSHTPPVSSSGVIYGFSITYFLL